MSLAAVVLTEGFQRRFWRKVRKTADCWIWTGKPNHSGYGRIGWSRPNVHLAHRVSWIMAYGPIPDELRVLHRCDNPPCVRPDHLFLGTQQDNMRDAAEKGRMKPPPHGLGEDAPNAKLTERDVLQIRKRVAAGEFQKRIAKEYGVNPSNVSAIKRRLTWRHLA